MAVEISLEQRRIENEKICGICGDWSARLHVSCHICGKWWGVV